MWVKEALKKKDGKGYWFGVKPQKPEKKSYFTSVRNECLVIFYPISK